MLDRGMIHVVVVILSTFTDLGLERSGSYCCYIVYHFCVRFDRGVVHVILVGYNVYHYCFRLDTLVVHVVLVILSTITA